MYSKKHLVVNKHSFNLKGYGSTIARGRPVLGVYGGKTKRYFRLFETTEAYAVLYQQAVILQIG
jgi:hypothetical protein